MISARLLLVRQAVSLEHTRHLSYSDWNSVSLSVWVVHFGLEGRPFVSRDSQVPPKRVQRQLRAISPL